MAGTERALGYYFTETLSEDTQLTVHYISKLLDRFSTYFVETNIGPKTFTDLCISLPINLLLSD